MEENEIQVISQGGKLDEVSEIIQQFLQKNANEFTFSTLSSNNRRNTLWASLFQHIQCDASAPVHALCLATIRVLSRDKTDLESLINEKRIRLLIERSGLNFKEFNHESMSPMEMPTKEIAVEALKCLCNIAFNSEVARALCAHSGIAQGLVARMRTYKEIPYKDDIILFDMKLLFILTALRQDIKNKIKDELHGLDFLICCLNDLLVDATLSFDAGGASTSSGLIEEELHCFLNDNQHTTVCELLKAMFNLIQRSNPNEPISEKEEYTYLKLMPVLTSLLYAHTTTEDKLMELRSNVGNLLTSVPPSHYQFLTPPLNEGEKAQNIYDVRNMDALQALVNLLRDRLTKTTNTSNQHDNLAPILTVMIKGSRGCSAQRKYLRQVVLPPLRDVSRPPEKGNALRNQLCRLLTSPVTTVRDLVAEFLFILCKEKVGRMVKYTGFGNAAGHLAQKGLLGEGLTSGQVYSSSSDDSDTEEYIEAQPHIDPVVGCTRPPRSNPFEGMTDEQKEYEAMKLVNLFDRMVSQGVVRPALVGPDGRPQPVDHVMELRENPPNRPQS